jgi:hypothetical protein
MVFETLRGVARLKIQAYRDDGDEEWIRGIRNNTYKSTKIEHGEI